MRRLAPLLSLLALVVPASALAAPAHAKAHVATHATTETHAKIHAAKKKHKTSE